MPPRARPIDMEKVREEYFDHNRTLREIGQEMNVDPSRLSKLMRAAGYQLPTHVEKLRSRSKKTLNTEQPMVMKIPRAYDTVTDGKTSYRILSVTEETIKLKSLTETRSSGKVKSISYDKFINRETKYRFVPYAPVRTGKLQPDGSIKWDDMDD